MPLIEGKHIPADPSHFSFDAEVAEVFDDMAHRSIPGYDYVYDRIEDLSWQALKIPNYAQVWDFGTSTGRGLQAVQRGAAHPYIHYMACDISEPMVARAQAKCPWADVRVHDLSQGLPDNVQEGRVAIAMFGWTLQFIESQSARRRLIAQTYEALMPGGLMFVMEKFDRSMEVCGESLQNGYIAWRRNNGYTLKEIEAKSIALQGAMFPWSPHELISVTSNVGFKHSWLYQMYNFGGIVARK